jgi:hypothetical protein
MHLIHVGFIWYIVRNIGGAGGKESCGSNLVKIIIGMQ